MTVVIVGAGHAGVQAADSLRAEGFAGRVVLMDKDHHPPYQRPPLSKAFMMEGADPEPLPLRTGSFFDDHQVELMTGVEVTGVDTIAKSVSVARGDKIAYDQLILATGADARKADCPGSELRGISYLRTVTDAVSLRERLRRDHRRVVVVGAGFIGLEFAAVAAKRGLHVTVIDFAQRAMQRVLSPSMSNYFHGLHSALGVDLHFDEGLSEFIGQDGRVVAVRGTSGEIYPCDFTVVGLGAVTDDALATTGRIATSRGVVVNVHLETNVEDVYAIGDVALFPSSQNGGHIRLESVQNATDMAKSVARSIVRGPTPYSATPWFWSNQGAAKLQIVGLASPTDIAVERGDPAAGKFSQFLFRNEALVAVESVNSPGDHVAARKIFDHGATIRLNQMRDPGFDLKSVARQI